MLRRAFVVIIISAATLIAQPRLEKIMSIPGWCCDHLVLTWTDHPVVTIDRHADAECVLYLPGIYQSCTWQSEHGIHTCRAEKTKKPLPGTRITIATDRRYSIRYVTSVFAGKPALVILFIDQQVCTRLKNHYYAGGVLT